MLVKAPILNVATRANEGSIPGFTTLGLIQFLYPFTVVDKLVPNSDFGIIVEIYLPKKSGNF